MKKLFNFWLEEELLQDLKTTAFCKEVSMASLTSIALKKYLEEQKPTLKQEPGFQKKLAELQRFEESL